MPLYHYICGECGEINKFIHSITTVKTTCKFCTKDSLERDLNTLFTAPAAAQESDDATKRERRIKRGIAEHKRELNELCRDMERKSQ